MAKVLISVDDALLRRVDRAAKSRGLTRSGYLAALARREVDRELGPGTSATARRALLRLDALFAGTGVEDSTEAVRAERDAR